MYNILQLSKRQLNLQSVTQCLLLYLPTPSLPPFEPGVSKFPTYFQLFLFQLCLNGYKYTPIVPLFYVHNKHPESPLQCWQKHCSRWQIVRFKDQEFMRSYTSFISQTDAMSFPPGIVSQCCEEKIQTINVRWHIYEKKIVGRGGR